MNAHTPPSSWRLWGSLCLFFALAAMLSMPTACSTPQLGISLYQSEATKDITLSQLGTVLKPPLEVSATDGTKELLDLNAPSVTLPKFRCQEWLQKASEDNEGTALGLLPTMIFNGFVKGELALSGRFPIDVACRKLKASILMAPPGQLSAWRPQQDNRTSTAAGWKRVGHAIVRLPDGRHLISGGAGALSFDDKGLPNVTGLVTETFLYDPATGTLQDGPTLSSARAFHQAFVLGEQVFLTGGLDAQNKIAATEGFRLPGLEALAAGDFPESIKALTPRAFQRVLKIKETGPGDKVTERIVQIGGISCAPAELGAACVGDQLLFSQVVAMPKRGLVMVIGGMQYNKGFTVWQPLGDIHVYTYAELGTTFALEKAGDKLLLSPPRMGHVAVRQDDSNIWIFGGLVPPADGTVRFVGANRINSVNILSIDEGSRLGVKGLFVVGNDLALGRALSTGIPLDKGRVLVLGGYLRVPAKADDPGTLAPQALVLQVDPGDLSGSTLQVHTLAHTPRLLPLAYLLATGQHWISGGVTPGTTADAVFAANDAIQLYNPRPEASIGDLVKFELLSPDAGNPEPPREGGTETPQEVSPDGGPIDAAADAGEPTPELPAEKASESTPEKAPETTSEGTSEQSSDASGTKG